MLKKLIKDNSIYHGDEGTSGYSLSDEQVDRIYEAVMREIEGIHKEHYMVWVPTCEQVGYRKAQMDIINKFKEKE